jgi:hypothetical protein
MRRWVDASNGPRSEAAMPDRWTKSHDVFDRLETGISEVAGDYSDFDEVLREAIF